VAAGREVAVLKQDFSEILGSGCKKDYEIEKVEQEDEIFRWPEIVNVDYFDICVSEDIKYLYADDWRGSIYIWDMSDPQHLDSKPIMQFTWDLKEDRLFKRVNMTSDNKYAHLFDEHVVKLFHKAR
jgi:hypothetical protein